MPKQQAPSNARTTRLASSGSPLVATIAAGAESVNTNIDQPEEPKASKLQLPPAAAAIRKALHADGKEPTDDEIAEAYTQIIAIVPGYSRKVHSNYFTSKRRGRVAGRGVIAAQMENVPNPTLLDILLWTYQTGLSSFDVFRIVMGEVSDDIKELAKTEYLLNCCKF